MELDEDRNGMLNKFELEKFAKSRYSREFIHRVFEECQTFGGELVRRLIFLSIIHDFIKSFELWFRIIFEIVGL